jgi:cobalt/nickel transport system permease protein
MSHIHIPDGVVPAWLWAGGWVLTLLVVSLAGTWSQRSDARRKVPLLGAVSALMLVAMSSEIVPIAYHLNLTVVAGVLLGPVLGIIAAFIVEVILAMLGHGGVTVLGLNTLIVASEVVVGWAVFRTLMRALSARRARLAAGAATALTLALSTTLLVGIVALVGSGATARESGALDPATLRFENPFAQGVFTVGLFSGGEHEEAEDEHGHEAEASALSVARFAAVVYTLGPIGWFIEALVTAGLLGYIARVRPSLVFAGALRQEPLDRPIPGDEAGGY